MFYDASVEGTVTEIRSKTNQRVGEVIRLIEGSSEPLSYEELQILTGGSRDEEGRVIGGCPYDILLYVLTTLICVGFVTKHEVPDGPGRPRVFFRWDPQAGARQAFSAVSSSRAAAAMGTRA